MSTQFQSNNPSSYLGILATNPGQNHIKQRAPLTTDYKGFLQGDRWWDEVGLCVYGLVSKIGKVSTWIPMGGGTVSVGSLTPDVGAIVTPIASNIDVIGDTTQGVSTYNAGAASLGITVQTATTALRGVVNLATNAEAIAGTDTAKAVTSDDLKAKLGVQTVHGVLVGSGTANAVVALAAGTATQVLQSGGAGADPAYSTATYPATTAAEQVLISTAANTVTSSANITSTTGGIVTTYLQSGASAYLNVTLAAATGDGTSLTIPFDTEDYDIQAEFDTGTSTFTAKSAGVYAVTCNVLLNGIGVGQTTGNIAIIKSGTNWWQAQFNPTASQDGANQYSATGATILQLPIGGTIHVTCAVTGGAKSIGIVSAAGSHTTLQIAKIA